jgi:hypothetical protein
LFAGICNYFIPNGLTSYDEIMTIDYKSQDGSKSFAVLWDLPPLIDFPSHDGISTIDIILVGPIPTILDS